MKGNVMNINKPKHQKPFFTMSQWLAKNRNNKNKKKVFRADRKQKKVEALKAARLAEKQAKQAKQLVSIDESLTVEDTL